VVSLAELQAAQVAVKTIRVDGLIQEYIVSLVDASRHHPDVYLGASPRGSLALFKTTQAWAAIQGRDYVIPDDVKALAGSTLGHRLIISPAARIKNVDARQVVLDLLSSVPIPGGRVGGHRSP
jgi:MoxR-like ATPase